MSLYAGGWICNRCGNQNLTSAGVCQNPYCGGEPVSRTVEAVSPVVHFPSRQCMTSGGVPKIAYASFDDAHDVVQSIAQSQRRRVHAYRCTEHGWHVGSNRAA